MNSPSPQEAIPMNDTSSIAIMAVELRYIKETVERIEQQGHNAVRHDQWSQRNEYVDKDLAALWKANGELKAEIASKRAPWWAIVASIAALVSIFIQVIPMFK